MIDSLHNEKTLFSLIAQGDETAFEELYNRYVSRLSAYIFKLCKSAYITEDALQEVFIKLWSNRNTLANIEMPEAFIISIAKNTTIDYLRKLSKQTSLIADLKSQIQENSNDAEKKMSAESIEKLIASALSQLSPQKQKVFQLSKVIGLSHDEIADEMHLSKSTVKNHLSETIKHIRKQLRVTILAKILLSLLLALSCIK